MTSAPSLDQILAQVQSDLGATLDQTGWAEEEIEAAQGRHPRHWDLLYHGFCLLRPTLDMNEMVYRAHCRELLERLVADEDTRVPTAAEVVLVCRNISLITPINGAGTLVYMRAWRRAFPDLPAFESLELESYEHVSGSRADELESAVLRRVARSDRRLPKRFTCAGRHHGVDHPDCRFVEAA